MNITVIMTNSDAVAPVPALTHQLPLVLEDGDKRGVKAAAWQTTFFLTKSFAAIEYVLCIKGQRCSGEKKSPKNSRVQGAKRQIKESCLDRTLAGKHLGRLLSGESHISQLLRHSSLRLLFLFVCFLSLSLN